MAHLRLVFMGTPEFAVPALSALLDAGHEVACVYSQPPRAAGRGRHARPSPVQAFAEARGIAVRSPVSLKTAEAAAAFAALEADAAVVAAYGLILPQPILSAPRLGCVNIHPSLLPRWRGAAPIQRAILAGDTETGVTIMLLEEGLDCGPILLAARVAIGPDTTGGALHDQLAKLGGGLVVAALAGLDAGTLTPRPQPEEGVTYAPKLTPGEERLDWRAPAAVLARKVRAFNPWPGTWFPYEDARIRVIEAEAVAEVAAEAGAEVKATPGTVLDRRLTVACGEGALRLVRLQRAGRRALDAEAFLRGRHIPAGTVLELPA